MSKKKLLEESTIRSFMKLANLQPLSDKFIKESWKQEESLNEKAEEEEEEEEEEEGLDEELAPPADPRRPETGLQEEEQLDEEVLDEEMQEEGDIKAEGREGGDKTPSSPKQKVKGVTKPGKMAAAKNAPGDAKLKPVQKSSHHSDKPDSIEAKHHSNAPKKNNSQFEVVTENLEEMGMEKEEADTPEGGDTPSAAAGEGGDHQAKMKELIRGMLNSLKDMGAEYGMSMEISDEGESEEMSPPESEAPPEGAEEEMMQEKLDEMVEKLTKRVAARLVKESKKKR